MRDLPACERLPAREGGARCRHCPAGAVLAGERFCQRAMLRCNGIDRRYGHVYLMKYKSEAFEKFREYKNEVEVQTGNGIKALRSDRGAHLDYEIWQMDMKIIFLNGNLEEEVYVIQHERFMFKDNPDKIFTFADRRKRIPAARDLRFRTETSLAPLVAVQKLVVTASTPSPGWKAAALGLTRASGDPFGRRIQLILVSP
ncbi:hypothetical protein MUK42_05825 [Musa troglodytarum]|uniref:Uncharacterized protein n=1 Tax=Musa troglodytarum TaxID=320322 RepID=A0A9E7L103_9LILI|nr:hypothetical protein MUK42_05825 [Musa troglodytarum]